MKSVKFSFGLAWQVIAVLAELGAFVLAPFAHSPPALISLIGMAFGLGCSTLTQRLMRT